MSLVMGFFVYLVGLLRINAVFVFCLQICSWCCGYIVFLSILTKIETFDYCLNMVMQLIDEKRKYNIDG